MLFCISVSMFPEYKETGRPALLYNILFNEMRCTCSPATAAKCVTSIVMNNSAQTVGLCLPHSLWVLPLPSVMRLMFLSYTIYFYFASFFKKLGYGSIICCHFGSGHQLPASFPLWTSAVPTDRPSRRQPFLAVYGMILLGVHIILCLCVPQFKIGRAHV